MCVYMRLFALLEQNEFNISLKSFDDNKVLKKLSIGYANICFSVQDHRQKLWDH